MKNKINILLVEDVIIGQKMAIIVLEQLSLNLHIDVAASGTDALKYAEKNQYDAIFMDLGLPDISGIDVTKQIKAIKKNKNVPIIALTAHNDKKIREECVVSGMTEFIEKPLKIEACKEVFSAIDLLN